MKPEFKDYAKKIIDNAKVLAEELMNHKWRLVSGGTDNHLMLIDLRSRNKELTGHAAADWLAAAGIISNWNKIPHDPRPPMEASGIRLGTPALTTRGMGGEEMKLIAGWIDEVLTSDGSEEVTSKIRNKVTELCEQFPIPNHNHS